MRQTLTSILGLLFLGGLVALGQSLPFNILVSLDISMPDIWQSFTATERDTSNTSVQKKTVQPGANSPLALSTPVEEKPAASGANSADQANKPGEGPTLTIARISPSGPSVFGGTAAPFAQVIVLDGTTAVDTATANANGDWSLVTEHKFANADPKITLRIADASEKNKLASAAPANSPPPSAGITLSDRAPPAAQLLKKFEGVVAAAREEAKQRDVAGSVKEKASNGSVSAEPAVPNVARAQPPAASDSLSSSSPPSMTTTLVPMTFVYNEATLTPEGQGAARLLLEYLTLKKFASVTLSGHADERGLPNYNMELSRQRLITIEHVLRDGGYQGKLDLLPKGASEPFTGIDRSRYPHEELMQLDRRVELRVAN